MAKKNSVSGLHLWSVKDQHEEYWITTRTYSITKAHEKGARFAARLNSDSKVQMVTNHGTIDC